LAWDSFRLADASIALTPWEAQLLIDMYGAAPEKTHVIPNGVEQVFFDALPEKRGDWLICTATITERKRVLETAQAAVIAKVPLWVIGKPYSEKSGYMRNFLQLRDRHRKLIRYEGAITDRSELARAYRHARGFVLLSTMESLSLSALEAAACQCPLLLSDLPWAREHFGSGAKFCRVTSPNRTAKELRAFYEAAPTLPVPPKPKSWSEIGVEIKRLYERVASTVR
jgi:glycosyltransferase involved in cell wall biosynthesis